jgi:hypothetical protein
MQTPAIAWANLMCLERMTNILAVGGSVGQPPFACQLLIKSAANSIQLLIDFNWQSKTCGIAPIGLFGKSRSWLPGNNILLTIHSCSLHLGCPHVLLDFCWRNFCL